MLQRALAPSLRLATGGGILLALTGAAVAPAAAPDPTPPGAPGADRAAAPSPARPTIKLTRQHGRAIVGQKAHYKGVVRGVRSRVRVGLQVRRHGKWRTAERVRTSSTGRFRLSRRVRRSGEQSARVHVFAQKGVRSVNRRVRPLHGFRRVSASFYGPGLYGSALACGGHLSPGTIGVAHKTLPCGTKLTLRHGSHRVVARVIDRGPYVAGRDIDLTAATRSRLGFGSTGTVLMDH